MCRKFVEQIILRSGFSEGEKKGTKREYKQWTDAVLQGIKRRLREVGKLL